MAELKKGIIFNKDNLKRGVYYEGTKIGKFRDYMDCIDIAVFEDYSKKAFKFYAHGNTRFEPYPQVKFFLPKSLCRILGHNPHEGGNSYFRSVCFPKFFDINFIGVKQEEFEEAYLIYSSKEQDILEKARKNIL